MGKGEGGLDGVGEVLQRAGCSDPGEVVDEPPTRPGHKVWSVTPETAMRELFELADADGSGALDRSEVGEFIKVLRPSRVMTSVEVQMAMLSMDPEGTGTATFSQFSRWWMSGGARTPEERREFAQLTAKTHPQENARAIFNMIDVDGGGTLDRAEIRKAGTVLGKIFTSQELDEAMGVMDKLGTGEVDFTAFYAWYTSHRSGMNTDRSNANRLGLTAKLQAEKIARQSELAAREELMEAHSRLVGKSKMRQMFDEIDADGSGVLDEEEVAAFVRKLKPTKVQCSYRSPLAGQRSRASR